MIVLNNRGWGWGGVVSCAVALVAAPVACTGGFTSEDCKATRTCTVEDSGGQGGESITEPPVGGDGGTGGGAGAGAPSVLGGAASEAGAGAGAGGCSGAECGPRADPPFVVRVSPEADADEVEPTGDVVVELSEELDEATVTAASFQVLDGETALDGELVYGERKITFTPSLPLRLKAEYSVQVSTAVADAEGENLLAPFSSKFTVRDGAWKVADVVDDKVAFLADSLPITAQGHVLVAWSGSLGGMYCSVAARWFAGGAALGDATPGLRSSSCTSGLTAAADAAGHALFAWPSQVPNAGIAVRRFDGAAWEETAAIVSAGNGLNVYRAAMGGAGDAHVFASRASLAGTWVYRTAGEQAWPATPQTLAADTLYYRPSVGFDAEGNGVAIWKSRVTSEVIRVSTYSALAGTWSSSIVLPGSTLNTADFEIGQPALAVAPSGEAVAVWRIGPLFSESELLASYFDGKKWSTPKVISAEQHGFAHEQGLSVVHDRGSFVVAWEQGDKTKTFYTAEFTAAGGWSAPELQVAAGSAVPGSFRLLSGGRGPRMLMWAVAKTSSMALWTKPFAGGAWGSAALVPGAEITGTTLQELPVAMNESGMVAVAWVNRGTDALGADVRLASFQ